MAKRKKRRSLPAALADALLTLIDALCEGAASLFMLLGRGLLALLRLAREENIDEMLEMLNKKSGLLGLSGISSDMRDIDAAADQGDRNASIARDMLIYGIRKYIGAYAAAMNGVDVIVFTAGIGENGIEMREKVMEGFEFLGAKIDVEKNRVKGEERDISAVDSKVKVLVIPTNEEIVIARDTLHLVTGK